MALVASHLPMFLVSWPSTLASVSLTGKPLSASSIEGWINLASGIVPHFCAACAMPATVPGTPTAEWV